ncbi:MAG TPA: Gfo/Idh/MocA family oxidoreductase [Steroidobacteraceae bacterium]|nr:Gfo/Idh/MocA family oxidoreductase [Steroidobacteraceae bacterium]
MVGLGKIARDQHLPTIAASAQFELVAAASPGATLSGIPVFQNVDELLASGIAVDALAMCQPPQLRFEAAASAIRAGKHVLLEKPPGATVSEVDILTALAVRAGTTLFAAWHSRHAPAVEPARAWLAGRQVRSVEIRWLEDVRFWHSGQQWIWSPGGTGVFDPGVNALSILTLLLPDPIRIVDGTLQVPANRSTPIAAELHMRSASGVPIHAVFDWRPVGDPVWEIEVKTDAESLSLSHGGASLHIAGRECELGPLREYPLLYQRFAELIAGHHLDADVAPLRLVADCFLCCATLPVEPFHDGGAH